MSEDAITRAELAKYLHVAESTLTKVLARLSGATCLRIGRVMRFRPADVKNILQALQAPACPHTYLPPPPRTHIVVRARFGRKAALSTQDTLLAEMRIRKEQRRARKAAAKPKPQEPQERARP